MSFREAIILRIAEERAEGHSVKTVAQRLGIRVERLRSWLRGDQIPDQRQLGTIARFLRVRGDQLLEMLPRNAKTARTGGPLA